MSGSTDRDETAERPSKTAASIRWWPFAVICILGGVAIALLQVLGGADRQADTVARLFIVLVVGLLSFFWLIGFSRLGVRTRLRVSAIGLVLVLLFVGGFRLSGVTGDLMPIFEWRFGGDRAPIEPGAPDDVGLVDPSDEPVEGLADFPQFFGPGRDGRLAGPVLARDWESDPPELIWRRAVGAGWSGFAVAGRRAVTQEQDGEYESVVCYDALTGKRLWRHRDQVRYDNRVSGLGPRATPTIDGGRVYTMGATGILNCLELESGTVLWSRDTRAEFDAPLPVWGVSCSPLVDGELVIVTVGGPDASALVAYDRSEGVTVWSGGDDEVHWSSPISAVLAGVPQVVIFNAGVAGHDIETGAVLWSYPWRVNHTHVCMPVVCGEDRMLISSGYGTGSELLEVRRDGVGLEVESLWNSRRLKAKFTNLIAHEGHVYGLDDGIMTCIGLADGKRRWKAGRYGHGQILLIGDVLLVTTERGGVVLLEATPEESRELGRIDVFGRKTWNPPALAGRYLLLRNDVEAACYRLPLR